ncbi:MAG: flagellar type III secretion system pore protein FliP [Oscillospiraceae bacterium]|nr:flagellar type III secretion system pore protein FliP [Oscillospiraceae bacterium]
MDAQTRVIKKSSMKVHSKTKKWIKPLFSGLLLLVFCVALSSRAFAQTIDFSLNTNGEGSTMDSLKLLFTFALIALAPSLLVMMTSFTRIVIVFSFLRNALGLQQTPPNQVVIGLALFLSLFIMFPTFTQMNDTAIQPFSKGEMTQTEAIEKVQIPLKEFMLKQTKTADLNLFLSISDKDNTITEMNIDQLKSLGLQVIVPAFITSELKRAFLIGFLLFLPFLVIDMIVASTLMSMGMVMLPPTTISLPFKLMLFIVVDGWSLIMEMLIKSFHY